MIILYFKLFFYLKPTLALAANRNVAGASFSWDLMKFCFLCPLQNPVTPSLSAWHVSWDHVSILRPLLVPWTLMDLRRFLCLGGTWNCNNEKGHFVPLFWQPFTMQNLIRIPPPLRNGLSRAQGVICMQRYQSSLLAAEWHQPST